MKHHKLTLWAAALIVVVLRPIGPSRAAAPLQEPPVPVIEPAGRAFLCRVVRRTVRDRLRGRKAYRPAYVPASLRDRTYEVIVRLREGGYLRAAASAGPAAVVRATRDAALRAAETLAVEQQADAETVDRLLVEIEVVGPPQALDWRGDWTKPRALNGLVEPGVHGLVLLGTHIRKRFAPSEVFTSDLVLSESLEQVAKAYHATPAQIEDVRLMRFRTLHWYEPPARDRIVTLHRGLIVLEPEVVNPHDLDAAIETLAGYMRYRQLDSGLFTYQYEPALDRYGDEQNLVRQVGAAAALAYHARCTRDAASRAAAERGIAYHRRGVTTVGEGGRAAYLATADGKNKLGVTALFTLTLAYHPQASRFAALRGRLVRGMLTLQHRSGAFLTAFTPEGSIEAQEYYPGEALLALAEHYRLQPDGRILDAFDRALSFYRQYYEEHPSPAFVSWQAQAFALMARLTKRTDFARYVFALTDDLAEKQLTPGNCRWPELWGGVAAYAEGRAGVATAAYLEAFADALELARFLNDAERVERYEEVVRRAARFVMQLQVRPEEAYFIRSPQDAVGGIRTSLTLNLLRIDHCQHALVGLLKARRALFPDIPTAARAR